MKISQREAWRLRKRVAGLEIAEEARRQQWSQQWIGGVEVARSDYSAGDRVPVALRTANRLNHAVVAFADPDGLVRFIALPHPKVGA